MFIIGNKWKVEKKRKVITHNPTTHTFFIGLESLMHSQHLF